MTNFNWYFTREDIDNKSPSREDGVTLATEIRYRREGARLIINASNTLGLRYETTATGVVFFHRFFMMQSFRQFSRWVVASACLLLAGKVEETPKKCRDIIKVCQSLLTEQQMSHHFGTNPKDELTTHERILLQTIKFDLQVEHPYSYLLKFAKQLNGEKAKIEKLVQMAWTFMNDSLCTSLCLQWESQAIAIAFIYLAGKLSKFDLMTATKSKSRSWWRQYLDTLDVHDLESICHQVLDIYGEEEHKSGEESGTSSESTAQITPSTSQPSSITTSTQLLLQQTQPTYTSLTPVNNMIPLPLPHQQYTTHYQQHPNIIQPPLTRAATPFILPANQTLTPVPPNQTHHHQPTPITPTQQGTTPLAYSTLNVNVTGVTPAHTINLQQPQLPVPTGSGNAVGSTTGTYQYPTAFTTPGSVPRPPSSPAAGNIQMQQRSFATGANAYPIQSFNKAMLTSFIGTGSGQTGLTRPGVGSNVTPNMIGLGLPRGVAVRGSLSSPLPPRAPHPGVPHVRSNLTPQMTGYHPNQSGHGVPTPQLPQTGTGVLHPPTTGNNNSNIAWPR